MDDRATRDILRRLNDLDRGCPQLRRGEVTDDSPLSIDLGGSGVPYTGCATVVAGLTVGNQVVCLVAGGDLVVIGELQ